MAPNTSLRTRAFAALAAFVAAVLVLSGCSGTGAAAGGRLVSIYSGNPGTLTNNFNPFASAVANGANGGILGALYEPLFYYNTAKNEPPKPWLGTAYTVSADALTYSVTLRDKVKWQDGQPFSAADVAYTYNLLKDKPALNLYGLKIASAIATDSTHVTIKLSAPDVPNENRLLGLTFIVPEHLWKAIADPATNTNPKPIGTGAFSFGQFTPQSFTLLKNAKYYEPGKPSVAGLRFVTSTGNAAALNSLNAGQIDWAGIALQDVKKSFVDKNPRFHKFTSIPADIKALFLNLSKAPFNDLAFRQALSLAVDRNAIIQQAFGGTDTVVNPTSLLSPRDDAYISPAYKGKTLETNVQKANQLLAAAGYRKDAAGHLLGKNGVPISFKIKTVSGYTDTITANQLLVQDFAALGIQATSQEDSLGAYATARQTGDFDVLDDRIPTGPNPFQQFSDSLDSGKSAPIGKAASANFVRFSNPTIDGLLATLAKTTDKAAVAATYQTLGSYFAQNQPYILLSQNGAVTTYRDQYFTGMPTTDNLFANPSNWLPADIGFVARELKPAK